MYPADLKPPNKRLANLSHIQDMDDVTKQTVTGHCIKAMISDPYGHPVFAAIDVKVGSVMVYDADDQQVLRKIGAGYHEMDSVVFDEQHNFVMAANKPGACSIMKHNLKGDHISTFTVEDASKIYAVACLPSDRLVVSLALNTQQQVVRVYDLTGATILLTIEDSSLVKPQYLVANGDRIVVGDIGTKSIKCLSLAADQEGNHLLWSYPMDMPRGMCIDGGGNICVCDFRSNRITLLSAEGKLIGHSLTGLSKPQYIAMNHNRLFVIDMGRSTSYRLSVYTLFKTPAKRRHGKAKPEWQD